MAQVEEYGGVEGKCNDADAAGKSVESVNEIDGVSDINDQKHGKGGTDPERDVNPANGREQASEGKTAQGEEGRGGCLCQEFYPVVHAHQIIGNAYKEEQHSAHPATLDAQERVGVASLHFGT